MQDKCGLEQSTSEYIIFMDADDEFYDCYSVENLYNKIEEQDMVIGAILIEGENESTVDYDHEGCLHGKMYRRSVIEKNNLKFNDLRSHEDNAFNQLYVLCCENIVFIEDIVYRYKFNPHSITRNKLEKQSLMDYIDSMTWLCKEIEKRNIKDEYDVGRRFCLIAYYCYFNYLLDTEEFLFVYDKMSDIKKMYDKYICKLSYDDKLYLYKNFDYPVIPTVTFFDFMDRIKND